MNSGALTLVTCLGVAEMAVRAGGDACFPGMICSSASKCVLSVTPRFLRCCLARARVLSETSCSDSASSTLCMRLTCIASKSVSVFKTDGSLNGHCFGKAFQSENSCTVLVLNTYTWIESVLASAPMYAPSTALSPCVVFLTRLDSRGTCATILHPNGTAMAGCELDTPMGSSLSNTVLVVPAGPGFATDDSSS